MTTAGQRDTTQLLEHTDIVWHQRFTLPDGAQTPGTNDVEWLWRISGLPTDLTGRTVLDVGTTNGGTAFLAERLGAARVVATDIVDANWFGFAAIRDCLGSDVEFVRTSVYELTQSLRGERFDLVIAWGLLYHLRHPLLGLDAIRRVATGTVSLETAIALDSDAVAHFHRRDELANDPTNWFVPSVSCVLAWCGSAGLDARLVERWLDPHPTRAMFEGTVTPGPPEFVALTEGFEQVLETRPLPRADQSGDGSSG